MEEVDMGRIRTPSFHYRDKDPSLLDLAVSVKEQGLLQPITVRVKDGFYEVVIGNRRLAACRMLGFRKITCNIVELDDKEAFELSLIENIHRRGLNPIEEARAFRQYISKYGRGSVSGLAKLIGRSAAYVDKRTRLLDLPNEVIEMISATDISVSAAEELLPIKDGAEQREIANIAYSEELSLKQVRELVAESVKDEGIDREDGGDKPTTYHCMDRWQFETRIADLDRAAQKSYDKAIVALRAAMNKIITIMDNIEDNWIIYEMLRQHKEMLHNQIDMLIKEKRKI
jgi:ParB family chromosome partitioning protein